MKREIQTQVQRIASSAVHDQGAESGMSEGAETVSEAVTAPAIGEYTALSESPLVPDTLELAGADGTLYAPDFDFYEDPSEGRFQNLSIPEGTALTATYNYEEVYASQGPHVVLSKGARMPQRESLDFRGFAVTDDEAADTTVITASEGSGGPERVVEAASESVLAPAINASMALKHGPLVGSSLVLRQQAPSPPILLDSAGPVILGATTSITPPAVAHSAGDTLIIQLMHRASFPNPEGWTLLASQDHNVASQVHAVLVRTIGSDNEEMPTIAFDAESSRAAAAVVRVSGAGVQVAATQATTDPSVTLPAIFASAQAVPLWFACETYGDVSANPYDWTISSYSQLYGDEVNGRIAAFSAEPGTSWSSVAISETAGSNENNDMTAFTLLVSATDPIAYEQGADYVEVSDPAGFTNLVIPEGTELIAKYSYYASDLDQPVEVLEIDGGRADEVYTALQVADGGSAGGGV